MPVLVVLVLALCAIAPPTGEAVKVKKNYYYRQCPKKSFCFGAAANSTHSRLIGFQLHVGCAAAGQSIDVLNVPKDVVISSRTGRFKFKKIVESFRHTPEGDELVFGEITIKGTVKRRKYIRGSWTIDYVADDCTNRQNGEFKLTYRFVSYDI
ncbi:MAG: hypothetical protein ACSLFF_04785 [Solirubrobacterales bacterium]